MDTAPKEDCFMRNGNYQVYSVHPVYIMGKVTVQYLQNSRYLQCYIFVPGRSMMAKKNDGIKESTDSSTTIEDEDTRGMYGECLLCSVPYSYMVIILALTIVVVLMVQYAIADRCQLIG